MNTTFIHFGDTTLRPFEPVVNNMSMAFLQKPSHGLWGCEYTPNAEYRSVWEYWCKAEEFRFDERFFLFRLTDDARVLRLSSVEDYLALDSKYFMRDTFMDHYFLNFEALARDFDALILCGDIGDWHTLVKTDEIHARYRNMTAWNVPSVLVFRKEVVEPV